jgi:drug/metabolite transporter (DMT)-like permease
MTRDARRAEGLLALVGVQLFFGLSPLFAQWTLEPARGFEPRALVAWRILFGAATLGGFAAWRHGRSLLPPRAELGRIAACALLGIVLNMWLYLEGVRRTSVVHAGLLVVQIPVFTYAFACLARVERLQLARVLGIALALVGAGLVVLEGARSAGGSATPGGDARILVNGACYALYLVLARGLLGRHPTLVVIAWVFWASLPAVPIFLLGVPAWPAEAPQRVLLSFGYTLLFATLGAYALNTYALARVPASTVAVFIFLQPLVAGLAGAVALGEPIPPPLVAAGAALLAGIVLVSRPPSPGNGTSGSIHRRAGRVFHSRR